MSKPGADPSSGMSLGDALRLPKRHPACRRREAQSGSGTERENLAGDGKGKGASGSNREAESTDAPERGGLPSRFDVIPRAVHRRQSRAQRRGVDANPASVCERVDSDIKRLRAASERLEGGRDVFAPPEF